MQEGLQQLQYLQLDQQMEESDQPLSYQDLVFQSSRTLARLNRAIGRPLQLELIMMGMVIVMNMEQAKSAHSSDSTPQKKQSGSSARKTSSKKSSPASILEEGLNGNEKDQDEEREEAAVEETDTDGDTEAVTDEIRVEDPLGNPRRSHNRS